MPAARETGSVSEALPGMNRRKTKKGVSRIDKSQTFSMDILIALGIFIVGIVVFLFIIGGNQESNAGNKLVAEADIVPQRLIADDDASTTGTTIVVGNKVDAELLKNSINRDYADLKREMEIVSDFCMHFQSDNGELIDLDDDPNWVQYSIGDPRLMITIQEGSKECTLPCGSRTYVGGGTGEVCP